MLISKPDNYGNSNLEYYYYTDDIFRTNTPEIQLGYIYIFYKPEKLVMKRVIYIVSVLSLSSCEKPVEKENSKSPDQVLWVMR
ncbi:MAG: hypothetical protein R2727_06715 [Bacteroidales bacterium]